MDNYSEWAFSTVFFCFPFLLFVALLLLYILYKGNRKK